jgi:penicillin-insensitive murein endopeptidase
MSFQRLLIGLILVSTLGTAWSKDGDPGAGLQSGSVGGLDLATPKAIGSYSGGCLVGGVALNATGTSWQTLFPDRNRTWGHPSLISYLERLAENATQGGWPGLLIGDMSQPRGGPMSSGHVSHQNGLDADIWYVGRPATDTGASDLADLSAISLINAGTKELDEAMWSDALAQLIMRAATDPQVSRIFVHPRIKERLCEWAGSDRSWLGDGCGAELAIWLGPAPPKAETQPRKSLQDLPPMCTVVLTEP